MRLDHLLSKENGCRNTRVLQIGVARGCCSILSELEKKQLKDHWEKNEEDGYLHGGVAQLGEHLPCKQGVMGSNPIISIRRPDSQARGT